MLKNIIKPRSRTVASIMAGFTAVVNELRSLEETKREEAAAADARMIQARDERSSATVEANLAAHQATLIEAITV